MPPATSAASSSTISSPGPPSPHPRPQSLIQTLSGNSFALRGRHPEYRIRRDRLARPGLRWRRRDYQRVQRETRTHARRTTAPPTRSRAGWRDTLRGRVLELRLDDCTARELRPVHRIPESRGTHVRDPANIHPKRGVRVCVLCGAGARGLRG